jgi:hypothetical protein
MPIDRYILRLRQRTEASQQGANRLKTRMGLAIGAIAFALLAGGIVIGLLDPGVAQAQEFSPYADFQAMTLEQLATLQVKLTYVGSQTAGIPSLAFTSSSHTLDLNAFVPFRRPGISYVNDLLAVESFSASPEELQVVIANVGTSPNVTAGGVAATIFLSFALFNSQPSMKGFEAIVNENDAAALLTQLRLSLVNNAEGSRKLSEMACHLNLLQPERPTDVSADVTVALSGVRLDRGTGRFVGIVLVTNNSAATLAAPISLVMDLGGNVTLANASGTTCGTNPVGREFVDLPGALGSGQASPMVVEFHNPDLEEIKLTSKVLSGPGAR